MKVAKFELIPKETVEITAEIMGKNSASYNALQEAKKYKHPVFAKQNGILIVFENPTIDSGYIPQKEQ